MVDEESAAYPWELLEDPLEGRGTDDRQPFSCRRGVLRQLESLEYRENIQPSTSMEALVVGDPVSSFVELKGAQAGGTYGGAYARCQRAVSRDSSGSTQRHSGAQRAVRPALSRASTSPVTASISTRLGHEPGARHRNGDRRRHVPDAARNRHRCAACRSSCSSIAVTSAASRAQAPSPRIVRNDYNRLAANVAEEFIRMGVRVVIAAGWAVDDEAGDCLRAIDLQRHARRSRLRAGDSRCAQGNLRALPDREYMGRVPVLWRS